MLGRATSRAKVVTCISHLPSEVIEEILSISSVVDVSAFSQTCRAYHDLVYRPVDNHLWRALFLNQTDYDDPRLALGQDALIPWDSLLQRWTAASKALRAHSPRYTFDVLQTLIQMVEYSRPASQPLLFDSRNLDNLQNLLRISGLLNQSHNPSEYHKSGLASNVEYGHMLSRLKLYAGLEAVTSTSSRRLHARSFVYNLRNYQKCNDFGPFIPDGSGRVHWEHLHAIYEVIVMNLMDSIGSNHSSLPMTMKHIQAQSIPRMPDSDDRDWAGLGGRWQVVFCFCDHRDLLAFNRLDELHDTPDLSIFEDENFEEALRFLEFELRLADDVTEPAPTGPASHLARQTLHFVGKISGNARVLGHVYMTPDNQVRWTFMSGETGETIWSTEAVQVGGVASSFGALGTWTTVFHDADDPVGPMWLWKLPD